MSERTAAELRALRASEHPSDVLDLAIEALEAREAQLADREALRKAAEKALKIIEVQAQLLVCYRVGKHPRDGTLDVLASYEKDVQALRAALAARPEPKLTHEMCDDCNGRGWHDGGRGLCKKCDGTGRVQLRAKAGPEEGGDGE